MTETRFGRAIGMAIADAMREDDRVILLGEDVAAYGGSFGVTRGLLEEFGEDRVLDTPISEASLASAALGAALSGLKPVLEIMFMDFVTFTMDAMVNQAAKARFMFGGQFSAPMVLRTPHGGGLNAGPQHSQCLEAWFAHVPGLKVVCPSNPADAYGLMRAAIDDPDPVIFVENKALYAAKGDVPENGYATPIGSAHIAREGKDVTVVTYGAMVGVAFEAAEALAGEDIDLEIIDLRTIQPWDEETVLLSLSKTHNLLVLHEAVEAFGVGAEIAARMVDIGFHELDGPIIRVAAPFMPVPFAQSLEASYRPDARKVIDAVRRTLA